MTDHNDASYPLTQVQDAVRSAAIAELDRADQGVGRLLILPGREGCGKSFMLDRIADACATWQSASAAAPKLSIVHDNFRSRQVDSMRTSWPAADGSEAVIEDVLDLIGSAVPFKSTIAKTLALCLRNFGASFGRSLAESLRKQPPQSFPAFLSTLVERAPDRTFLFLLDDVDYENGAAAWLPSLVTVIHRLSRTGRARLVVVITADADHAFWRTLQDAALWSRNWNVLPALGAFDRSEIERYCQWRLRCQTIPEILVDELRRVTKGTPFLLREHLHWLEDVGDVHRVDDVAIHVPDLAAEMQSQYTFAGLSTTASARIETWQAMRTERDIGQDVLQAASMEGQCFTLDAVFAYLKREGLLEQGLSFEEFAAWVDKMLVGNDEDSTPSFRVLTDTVDHDPDGTTKYGFRLPLVREHYWELYVLHAARRPELRRQLVTYAECLASACGQSSRVSRIIARLFSLGGDEPRAEMWSRRCDLGDDLATIDESLRDLRSFQPSSFALKQQIKVLCLAAAEIGDDSGNATPRMWERWGELQKAAADAKDSTLERRAWFNIAMLEFRHGDPQRAQSIVAHLDEAPTSTVLLLRADIHVALRQYRDAIEGYRSLLNTFERDPDCANGLSMCLTGEVLPPISTIALTVGQREHLKNWRAVANRLALVYDATRQTAAGLELLDRSLRVATVLDGPEDVITLRVEFYIANLLSTEGRWPEARQRYEDLLARQERVLGGEHVDACATRLRLSVALKRTGDDAAALALHERGFQSIVESLRKGDDPLVREMKRADILLYAGQRDAALMAYKRLARPVEQTYGPEHIMSRAISRKIDELSASVEGTGPEIETQTPLERIATYRDGLFDERN